MSDRLQIQHSGPGNVVARVTLNRPEVHNAFDAGLIDEIRRAFAGLAREEPKTLRAVVLAGNGPSFCAGGDVAWMRASLELDREGNEQDAMMLAHMYDAIDTCPVPVIARVHGAAMGGGMGLCAVSDLVIAESGAKFGFTETRLGILPAVIAPFVIAKIGESQARALFPGGRRFDAMRALRIGLVQGIHDPVLDHAVETARILASKSPLALRSAKRLLNLAPNGGHEANLAAEAALFGELFESADAHEGLTAFVEKREAHFTGR